MLPRYCKFVLSVGLAWLAGAVAPSYAASPTPHLEDATLAGAGGTLTVRRVPVQTATGSVVYRDILLLFGADAVGNLSLLPGYPKIRHSAKILSSDFLAGTYSGPPLLANGKYLIAVTGPGIGANGSTQWLLQAAEGADQCTYPQAASWFTGAIDDNPLASRLKAAGITSTDFSYGVAGGACCDGLPGGGCLYFYNGALLGMTQVGNMLRIVSFSDTGNDHDTPTAQVDYTLSP